jgi:hypothetical protein
MSPAWAVAALAVVLAAALLHLALRARREASGLAKRSSPRRWCAS